MFIKWIKRNKLKIFCSIALSFCLSLFGILAFSTKTYAYTINEDGNLVGENLFNIDNIQQSIINSTTITKPTTSYNYDIYTNTVGGETPIPNDFDLTKLIYLNIGTYYISCNIPIDKNLIIKKVNNDRTVTEFISYQNNSFTITESTYITIRMESAEIWSVSYLMINKGSTSKEWEPYGVWYSQANYNRIEEQYNDLYKAQQNNSLYYAFNNCAARLYKGSTIENINNPFITGTISIQEDAYNINTYSSPQIKQYLDSYNSDTWTELYYVIYYKPNVYFNNSLVLYVDDLTYDYDITFYYTDGTSTIYNSRDTEDYVIIANKERKNVNYITWSIYMPEYKYVELQLSIDGISYSTGYAQGYNNGNINGQNEGYAQGYNNGKNYANANVDNKSASYQAGYNQGKSDGLDIAENPNNSLYGMVIRS